MSGAHLVLLFPRSQINQNPSENGAGCKHHERLLGGWGDAWAVCMLVVGPRVQQESQIFP